MVSAVQLRYPFPRFFRPGRPGPLIPQSGIVPTTLRITDRSAGRAWPSERSLQRASPHCHDNSSTLSSSGQARCWPVRSEEIGQRPLGALPRVSGPLAVAGPARVNPNGVQPDYPSRTALPRIQPESAHRNQDGVPVSRMLNGNSKIFPAGRFLPTDLPGLIGVRRCSPPLRRRAFRL